MMVELDATYPAYDFKTHKGYITEVHSAALDLHGPSSVHRMRFVNVRRAAGLECAPDVQNGLEHVDPAPAEGPSRRSQA
jgi:ribonuclease HII